MTQLPPLPDLSGYPDLPPLPEQRILDKWLSQTKGLLFTMKGAGFLGSLLCNHNFQWDVTAPTAWCNGSTIAFNPWFFMNLERDTRVTLLSHELWHTGFDHMSRLDGRDPELWNIAADHVINLKMIKDGFSFKGLEFGCMDPQYENMSTEQVYEKLKAEGYTPPPFMAEICPEDGKTGNPDVPPDPTGGGPGGNTPTMCGDLRKPEPGTESEVKNKIVQAIQASKMSQEAGVIPGETEMIMEDFLNPTLPWETLLYKFMNEMSNDDYSWKRPSRRYEDEYLPSLQGENGLEHLIYYLDISGSVSDHEILRFNSEVKYIHEGLAPKRLTLVTFDTEIQDVYEFEEGQAFEKIVVHGRGGTSLDCVQKHIAKHLPTSAVVFSDLFCHPMTPDPGVPVLWIVLDNKRAKTLFGTKVHMDRHQI